MLPADSSRVCDTKYVSADWLYNWRIPQTHCHRENLQDCNLFHFAGSHNGNGLRKIGLGLNVCLQKQTFSPKGWGCTFLDNYLNIVVMTFYPCKGTADWRNAK